MLSRMNIRNNHSQCVRNVLRNLNLIWSPRLHRQENNTRILTPYSNKYTDGNGCEAIANRKTPTNRGFQKCPKYLFFAIIKLIFLISKLAPPLAVCLCARQLPVLKKSSVQVISINGRCFKKIFCGGEKIRKKI